MVNKHILASENTWYAVRQAAFTRESTMKEIIEDLVFGKISAEDLKV